MRTIALRDGRRRPTLPPVVALGNIQHYIGRTFCSREPSERGFAMHFCSDECRLRFECVPSSLVLIMFSEAKMDAALQFHPHEQGNRVFCSVALCWAKSVAGFSGLLCLSICPLVVHVGLGLFFWSLLPSDCGSPWLLHVGDGFLSLSFRLLLCSVWCWY
jgi:hypothetical protein